MRSWKKVQRSRGQGGIHPSPCYDLLNIAVYGNEFDRDLAMAVGEEFVSEEILPCQLAEFCDACRLPQRQVANTLKSLCTAVLSGLEKMAPDVGLHRDEQDFARKLLGRIGENARRFLALAGELPRVRL